MSTTLKNSPRLSKIGATFDSNSLRAVKSKHDVGCYSVALPPEILARLQLVTSGKQVVGNISKNSILVPGRNCATNDLTVLIQSLMMPFSSLQPRSRYLRGCDPQGACVLRIHRKTLH